jgi:HEPN domain-containing protein
MKLITQAWLSKALADLQASQILLNEPHLTGVVAFHTQQAVEKSFKAVIEEFDLDFAKTHNLHRLYGIVKPHCDLKVDLDLLEQLDAIY